GGADAPTSSGFHLGAWFGDLHLDGMASGSNAAAPTTTATATTSEGGPSPLAMLNNVIPLAETSASFPSGASAQQVQEALGLSGTSLTGTGIKIGVLSDSFNNL